MVAVSHRGITHHDHWLVPTVECKSDMTIDEDASLWIFGYGSLMFKRPLHHMPISDTFERYDGYIEGYIRRFWQSSSDNRGTPEYLGRVVTIIPAEEVLYNEKMQESLLKHELNHEKYRQLLQEFSNANDEFEEKEKLNAISSLLKVKGCVYRVPPQYAKLAREYLDLREQDGYTVENVEFICDGDGRRINCQVYVGTPENTSFVGAEEDDKTAAIIHKAVGPSGPNDEYLLRLQEQDPCDTYLLNLKNIVLSKKAA